MTMVSEQTPYRPDFEGGAVIPQWTVKGPNCYIPCGNDRTMAYTSAAQLNAVYQLGYADGALRILELVK